MRMSAYNSVASLRYRKSGVWHSHPRNPTHPTHPTHYPSFQQTQKLQNKANFLQFILLIFAIGSALPAQTPPSYAKDVAPIFAANCAGCHAATVRMGSLDLDTFEGLQKGGHSGPVIIPGKSADSRLYQMITGQITPSMPLNGKRLPDADIEAIRLWIDAGAKPPAPGEVVATRAPAIPEIKPRITIKPL